jgi:hypothetical protein
LLNYNKYLLKWFKEDEEFLTQKFSIINDIQKFQCADFELNELESIKSIPINLNWNPISIKNNNNLIDGENNKDNNEENKDLINKDNNDNNENNENNNELKSENDNNHNIILKNKIISLNDEYIMLRSIGMEVKVTLLMSGESNFFIFSRCTQSEFSELTTVCCISKELESARKFISFAVLEKKKEEEGFLIKNLKKQEIPHQDNYIKTLDLSEISFVFIDNGDNKTFVFLNKQEQNTNMLLLGDFYEPIEEKCNVMLACSGDLISLKEVEINQIKRDSYVTNMNNENIQCCQIF